MGPIDAVAEGFSKFVTYGGRASRSEYWWFTLFATTVLTTVYASAVLAGVEWIFVVFVLLAVVLYPPLLALQVRRLHDIGRSGWWAVFYGLLGWLGVLLLGCEGPAPANRWGFPAAASSVGPLASAPGAVFVPRIPHHLDA